MIRTGVAATYILHRRTRLTTGRCDIVTGVGEEGSSSTTGNRRGGEVPRAKACVFVSLKAALHGCRATGIALAHKHSAFRRQRENGNPPVQCAT